MDIFQNLRSGDKFASLQLNDVLEWIQKNLFIIVMFAFMLYRFWTSTAGAGATIPEPEGSKVKNVERYVVLLLQSMEALTAMEV